MTIKNAQATREAPVMLRPSQIVARYGVPRDRLYRAISACELPAYDIGSPYRPAFLLADADVRVWLDSLRVGHK